MLPRATAFSQLVMGISNSNSYAITSIGLNDDLKQIVKEEGSNIIELPSLGQIIKVNNYED